MSDIFEQILHENKIAYAIFDDRLKLQQCSRYFQKLLPECKRNKTASLYDILPELVGSEKQVAEVLDGKTPKYAIEKLNRASDSQVSGYYDILLLRCKSARASEKRLLLINVDTTAQTSLEQKVQQQRFEIMLLQSSLSRSLKSISSEIIGQSTQIQRIREFVAKISRYHSSIVLLEGETGTGKNLVAQLIHQNSTPPNSPFIEINCASIPINLIESEIFGYDKGAFTNAVSAKPGLLEAADRGTFFLDEISELPPSLQSKFLSFLETKKFRRLGSTQERSVNTRIIAATNQNLQTLIERKEFRLDLFFRLNVLQLRLPPLRELGRDILLMAEYFAGIYAYEFKKRIEGFSDAAANKLSRYAWPGNVRELRNVVERAVIFAAEERIEAQDILLLGEKAAAEPVDAPDRSDNLSLFDMEKQLIAQALRKAQGNQTRAAKLLGLSLDTLRYRIKKYEIEVE